MAARTSAAGARRARTPAAGRPADGQDGGFAGDPDQAARQLCLRQLDARTRTRSELARYLTRKGIPDDAAERVLDRFVEVGLIDDAALAFAFTSARQSSQGLARRAIAVKLRQRGVDDDLVAAATATVEPDDEAAAARRLVVKRLPALAGLDRAAQTRRLVGLLGRKGYPAGMAYRIVAECLALDTIVEDGMIDDQ